ncbi:MAG: divalent-cation tolerance protein CutA [Candidatus Omnitrophica bacterium]|nr:divalent-cation tolerance protein CutA [Candidatus Omnitrophota bacterium]
MNIVILITAKNQREAKKISSKLLEKKLVACCNIIKGVQSFFWWKGKIDSASEVMLVLKTKKSLFLKIVSTVKKLHSYETPEIIALPIVAGDKSYLKWINASVDV